MARPVVKTARQRYEMVPKLDDDGKQVVTPVLRKDSTPKKTRGGKEVTRAITVADKSRPLPPRTCEKCGKPLVIGQQYREVAIKTTYGGYGRFRCMECPVWLPWELSSALWARIAQIQTENVTQSWQWTEEGDAEAAASDIAEQIRELAAEKQEAADNMESGFGHSTSMSEEIADQAQQLESWADEVEQAGTEAEFPEGKCENCGGEQLDCSTHEEKDHDPDCDGTEECVECSGSGEGETVSEEDLDAWREEAASAIQNALDNSPLQD